MTRQRPLLAFGRASRSAAALAQARAAAAVVAFAGPHLVAFSSEGLQGEIIVFDFRTSTHVRSIRLPEVVRSLGSASGQQTLGVGGDRGAVFAADAATGDVTQVGRHSCGGPVQCASPLQGAPLALVTASGSTMLHWGS